jgi:two-component system cell cycle sensor histidine kinase/response regulator CckA
MVVTVFSIILMCAVFILILFNIILLIKNNNMKRMYKEKEKLLKKHEELVEAKEKYELVMSHASDAIFILQDQYIKFTNLRCEEIMEYEAHEIIDKVPFIELILPEDRDWILSRYLARARGEDVPSSYDFRAVTKTGRVLWVRINVVRTQWKSRPATLNFVQDITPQKKLENQLLQSQKIEAVGRLAAGIAHDFNNLLQTIIGATELLMLEKTITVQEKKLLKAITNAVNSGKRLTRQLLTFGRKVETDLRPIKLNHVIEEAVQMLKRTIPKMIEIQTQLSNNVMIVDADHVQMEQVVMNLALNAADAMKEGGLFTIKAEPVHLNLKNIQENGLNLLPGKFILITVSDTGCGIKASIIDHIFEPFFTTKDVGNGTGLGLSIVYGIIKNHHGAIYCHSQEGKGTDFSIYLPEAKSIKVQKDNCEDATISHKGSECVLFIDDEEDLRILGKHMLIKAGYSVLTASNGREGLSLFKENQESINLIILDLIMPGMSGLNCMKEILKFKSKQKIIVSSGFSFSGLLTEALQAGAAGVLSKPYNMNKMLESVRKVLDEDKNNGA